MDIVNKWLNSNNVEQFLKDEINNMNQEQLATNFGEELTFGTAGIRGILGAGTSKLNSIVIKKATLGLAQYLVENYPDQEIKVAVGYDSRHFSKKFSEDVAVVLSKFNIQTLIYDQVKPTPLLSFAVRHFGCKAGIMITASHNPKEYNGYKVYNETGSQLNLDQTAAVVGKINSIEDILAVDFADFNSIEQDYVHYIDESIDEIYLKAIESIQINPNEQKDIKVVFSPVHGTSGKIGPKAMNYFGYENLIIVSEQAYPDSDFTNTKSANPEEPECFELSLEYAKRNDADFIIINDPDADRLGVMFKNSENEYEPLTGNQLGMLLIDYILNAKQLVGNEMILNTIVSGEMGTEVARSYGVEVIQTLTGFKFIGEQIQKYLNVKQFIFGYEESYGYLIKDVVRDKDAIQSMVLATEMTNYYLNQGIRLDVKLNELYEKFGYYQDVTKSITLSGAEGLKKINDAMHYYQTNEITHLASFPVNEKLDYNVGVGELPAANVIKFYTENGWVVLRPSGTEPKLKVYYSIKAESLVKAAAIIDEIQATILQKINEL